MAHAIAAYAGLFAWSFLAATILPLSSEAPLAALVYQRGEWIVPVFVATLGNYLGACTTYALARAAARAAGAGDTHGRVQPRAARLVAKYGAPAMLLSWVPLVGDALVAIAGAAAMPFARFSTAVIIGKAARYAVVAWIAWRVSGHSAQ
jgi:membrane protein YqaA with SNARE-associated domain